MATYQTTCIMQCYVHHKKKMMFMRKISRKLCLSSITLVVVLLSSPLVQCFGGLRSSGAEFSLRASQENGMDGLESCDSPYLGKRTTFQMKAEGSWSLGAHRWDPVHSNPKHDMRREMSPSINRYMNCCYFKMPCPRMRSMRSMRGSRAFYIAAAPNWSEYA
jgi:hypothetical protein